MKPKRTASRSNIQIKSEKILLENLGNKLGISFSPKEFKISSVKTMVDGYCELNGKIYIAEVYSHQGKLKPAQKNKVYADILKLMLIKKHLKEKHSKEYPAVLAYIVFGDKKASEILDNKSWGAEAARRFNILGITPHLEPEVKEMIKKTQKKQDIRINLK